METKTKKINWEYNYKLAELYYKKNSDLLIPERFIIDDVKLGVWITIQRKSYKNNKLSPERINKLESIGMVWDVLDMVWNYNYKLAEQYYEENGDLLISERFIIKNVMLGVWIETQRKSYKNNKLSPERINKLNSIGMVWDICIDFWEYKYKLAKQYYEENSDLLVDKNYKIENIKLGRWIITQRKAYKANKISQERIDKLNSVGMVWDICIDAWEYKYELAKQYYKENNNLLIKENYEIDGVKLGNWISEQRYQYSLPNNNIRKTLDHNKITKLSSIGMIWNLYDYIWEENYLKAKEYFKKNKSLLKISIKSHSQLSAWLSKQRKDYLDNKLSEDKIEKLESIRINWDTRIVKKNNWNKYFELAKQYYKKNGDLLIPTEYIIDGIKLGNWLSNQRNKYKKQRLLQERIEKLEQIGIIWENYDNYLWNENYLLAKEFFKKHGNLKITHNYEVNGKKIGRWIQTQRQAYRNKNQYNISEQQVKLLNDIGMEWDDVVNNCKTSFPEQSILYYFNKWFDKTENRYTDLGYELDIYVENIKLACEWDGSWHKNRMKKDIEKNDFCLKNNIIIIRIREPECPELNSSSIDFRVRNNRNNEIQKALLFIANFINSKFNLNIDLSTINMKKDAQEIYDNYMKYLKYYDIGNIKQWDIYYDLAKKYYEEYGNLLVKHSYEIDDIKLGLWISNQRNAYKGISESRLSTEQILKLNEINMIWDVLEYKWNIKYNLAKKYYEEYGNLLVEYNCIYDNVKLGMWIFRQREEYKNYINGKNTNIYFTKNRIELLNSIKMVWTLK